MISLDRHNLRPSREPPRRDFAAGSAAHSVNVFNLITGKG
jgi:hypothetical protein